MRIAILMGIFNMLMAIFMRMNGLSLFIGLLMVLSMVMVWLWFTIRLLMTMELLITRLWFTDYCMNIVRNGLDTKLCV